MGTPVAAGVVSHSGTLTPEIWSAKTNLKFYTATIFNEIANTMYEGEIKQMGDSVHISDVADVTINSYLIGQKLKAERPVTTNQTLVIDHGEYYNVVINHVEVKQSHINYVAKWSDDAGRKMAIKVDQNILGDVYADVSAYNKGNTAGYKSASFLLGASGAPVVLDASNILDYLIDCNTTLDELDVLPDNRWFALPPAFTNLIKKSDLKDASLAGDGQPSKLINGRIGKIDDSVIYKTNNLATTTDGANIVTNCMFGHTCAITFASQLVESRKIPYQDDFADLMQGLQVYGYKVIKPEGLGHLYARK